VAAGCAEGEFGFGALRPGELGVPLGTLPPGVEALGELKLALGAFEPGCAGGALCAPPVRGAPHIPQKR
jgi:hypothetical protein